jgi:hypothetical protein
VIVAGFLFLGLKSINDILNKEETINNSTMKISSPNFNNNGKIPEKYCCNGRNINPALVFEGIPSEAKSLVLILDDPDAPSGDWVHWILYNIPTNVSGVKENSVPSGAIQGLNSWSKNNYGGPCPPSGTHRYVFKLYALNVESVNLSEKNATKANVLKEMSGKVLSQAQLVGLVSK